MNESFVRRCGERFLRRFVAVFYVSAVLLSVANAEPLYFIHDRSGAKFPSNTAACEDWRQTVQSIQDGPNPGGTTVITRYPSANLYPDLKQVDQCRVRWTRGDTSFETPINVYRGGCLPGSIVKDTSVPYPAEPGDCRRYGDKYLGKPKSCPNFGNPIYPLTGTKRQDQDLGIRIGNQPIELTYDTAGHAPEANGGLTWLVAAPPSFGTIWQSNFHKSISVQAGAGGVGSPYSSVAMLRGSNIIETASVIGFDTCDPNGSGGGGYVTAPYVPTNNPQTSITLTGAGSAGTIVDQANLNEETYASDGTLSSMSSASGGTITFGYTSGLLTSLTDQFGRSVQFQYEQPDGVANPRVNQITAPDGALIAVGYDANDNMQSLSWPDSHVRTFVYDDPNNVWAMTGIVDESNIRTATYGYDAQGRAISTFSGQGANGYRVTYGTPPSWVVTQEYIAGGDMVCRVHQWQAPTGTQVQTPENQTISMTVATVQGMNKLSAQDQPAGSGCAASSSADGYDANGNMTQHDDFNGNRTCSVFDLNRNLQLITLEGLPNTKNCPSTLAGYVPSPADATHPERLTTTAWHPDWVLKIQEAEPKKLTTWVYNGQPDPISGGTAACAPSAPALPDGKPIAVLCARYEQATTDATGANGLSATVVPGSRPRQWSYTYNQYGEVLTATAPKQSLTDTLSHTTTYTYYSDTSFSGGIGHAVGDMQTVTNPLGQITFSNASYDPAGRLLSSTDVNGAVTTQTYWPRGWLQSQVVTPPSGTPLTTQYAYYPTGLLQTVTLPNASTLSYAYDDAHRLTDVTDGAGNKVHYVLDNSGNRTSEQVSDASGNLASTIARVFDSLNRLQSVTGAVQ